MPPAKARQLIMIVYHFYFILIYDYFTLSFKNKKLNFTKQLLRLVADMDYDNKIQCAEVKFLHESCKNVKSTHS